MTSGERFARDSGRLVALMVCIKAKASAYSATKSVDLATCALSEIVDLCKEGIDEHDAMLKKLAGEA